MRTSHGSPTTAPLPSPLARLGAALLDLLFLLILYVLLFLITAISLPVERADGPFACAATICSLAYIIILWSRGQTLGKRVFGIKIIGPDGRPPGLLRAARRFLGYVVASLPLKIGLLPILWDPLRRGWHDQIAGTVVVKEQVDRAPSPPPVEPLSPDDTAPGSLRWRDLAMLPVFAIATAVLTWPAVARLPARFPSAGHDANVFVWSLWWVRKALLDPHLSVFETDYVFWPETVSLRLYSFSLLNCVLGVPLQSFLSLTLTYSVLLLLAICLTAFAAYLLGKYATGSALGGLLVGLFFGFGPYILWHAQGHLDLTSAQWSVLYMLLVVVLLKKAQARHAVLAAAALALAGLAAWHQLTFAAAFTAVFVPTWLAVHRTGAARRAALVALAAILGAVLLAPLLLPMARDFASGNYRLEALYAHGRAERVSLDAVSFLIPNSRHPLFGRWTTGYFDYLFHRKYWVEQETGHIGLTIPALALVAIWDRRRRRASLPWLATAVVCMLLSLGFNLRLLGRSSLPAWLLLAAGGPPGSGMAPPIVPSLAARVAMDLAGGSTSFLTSGQPAQMPFAWLWQAGGVMQLASAPARFVHIAHLCLAVLAALGILRLMSMARSRLGKPAAGAAAFAAAALVMFESLMAPNFPTEPVAMHPFYDTLAADRRCAAVLDLRYIPPTTYADTHAQRAQTIHGKKLYTGFLSRTPDNAYEFLLDHPLLADALRLAPPLRTYWPVNVPASPYVLIPARLAAYRRDLRALAQTGCCYILLHKDPADAGQVRLVRRLLGEQLALPIILDDASLTVFQVPPTAGPSPAARAP